MSNFNKVMLLGRVTRDIEIRHTGGGTPVARVPFAVNDRIKHGETWEEKPCFIDVTLFGKLAEIAQDRLSKGDMVMFEGRLDFHQWTDNDGKNRSKHTVVACSMQLFPKKNGNDRDALNDFMRDESGETDLPF